MFVITDGTFFRLLVCKLDFRIGPDKFSDCYSLIFHVNSSNKSTFMNLKFVTCFATQDNEQVITPLHAILFLEFS